MISKSPYKEVAALCIITATSANLPLAHLNACQADIAQQTPSAPVAQAFFPNDSVYDSKESIAANYSENTSQVTLQIDDEPASVINIPVNETPMTSANSTYDPGLIQYDDTIYLRFLKPFHLVMEPNKRAWQIIDWDINFPAHDLDNINKYLVRHFEKLYRKAQSNTLSNDEKKTWGKVVDSIDYASFSQEMSLPQFEIGQITALNNHVVAVEWIEGGIDRFRSRIPAFFTSGRVEKDDWFEALVRRGKHDKVVSIECPQKIDPPKDFDLKSLEAIEFLQ
jgi:hypothetical protein